MNVAFADTSFYIGLLSPRDRCHALAVEASEAYCGDIITTEYVLIELGNYLANISRTGFVSFVQTLRLEILRFAPHDGKMGVCSRGLTPACMISSEDQREEQPARSKRRVLGNVEIVS